MCNKSKSSILCGCCKLIIENYWPTGEINICLTEFLLSCSGCSQSPITFPLWHSLMSQFSNDLKRVSARFLPAASEGRRPGKSNRFFVLLFASLFFFFYFCAGYEATATVGYFNYSDCLYCRFANGRHKKRRNNNNSLHNQRNKTDRYSNHMPYTYKHMCTHTYVHALICVYAHIHASNV